MMTTEQGRLLRYHLETDTAKAWGDREAQQGWWSIHDTVDEHTQDELRIAKAVKHAYLICGSRENSRLTMDSEENTIVMCSHGEKGIVWTDVCESGISDYTLESKVEDIAVHIATYLFSHPRCVLVWVNGKTHV